MSDPSCTPDAQRVADAKSGSSLDNDKLEAIFDTLDQRTAHQQALHDHLAAGFMALARERYANPASLERLGHLVYDNRKTLRSSIAIQVTPAVSPESQYSASSDTRQSVNMARYVAEEGDGRGEDGTEGLRRRNGGGTAGKQVEIKGRDVRNWMMAMPSAEVREAMKRFQMAVDVAVEVVNLSGKVEDMVERAGGEDGK
eukprot:GFKZ01002580.1.p1 GENE.GFKZ01002580.1~~GFKZ01002580.1.p1  ORF type:complete len:199 (+),score=37.32 GFKZ01002580.1:105-701(+)